MSSKELNETLEPQRFMQNDESERTNTEARTRVAETETETETERESRCVKCTEQCLGVVAVLDFPLSFVFGSNDQDR